MSLLHPFANVKHTFSLLKPLQALESEITNTQKHYQKRETIAAALKEKRKKLKQLTEI